MKGYVCPPGCGRCCEDPGSPVELTAGDMRRIGCFLGIPLAALADRFGTVMWNRIPGTRAFVPSLGLAFPCGLRRGGRCVIYQVRPLACRLFPEGPALSANADAELYREGGYPCFDRGVRLSPMRARQVETLLARHREECRETAALFRNGDYACVLAAVEITAIGRALDGVPAVERNAARRGLCEARIPDRLKEAVRTDWWKVLHQVAQAAPVAEKEPCGAPV